jgi:hypothetical protein
VNVRLERSQIDELDRLPILGERAICDPVGAGPELDLKTVATQAHHANPPRPRPGDSSEAFDPPPDIRLAGAAARIFLRR